MGLMGRIAAVVFTLLGFMGLISTVFGVEKRWALLSLQTLFAATVTSVFLFPGLVLCWRTFPRNGLFDFVLSLVAGGVVFYLFGRFGSNWESYARHYDEHPQVAVMFGAAVAMASAVFVGLFVGQRAVGKLRWHPVSRLSLMACAVASAFAVSLCISDQTGTDVFAILLAISTFLFIPMLCVLTMSWTLRFSQRASSR